MLRCIHDGLVLIEACIEQYRHASLSMECTDQGMISRGDILINTLQSSRTIHMGYRWNFRMPLGLDRKDFFHERHRFVQFKPIANIFGEDGRRKRPEALAALDFGVEQFFGILATGICDDTIDRMSRTCSSKQMSLTKNKTIVFVEMLS